QQRIDPLRAVEAAQERLLADAERAHDDVIREREERLDRLRRGMGPHRLAGRRLFVLRRGLERLHRRVLGVLERVEVVWERLKAAPPGRQATGEDDRGDGGETYPHFRGLAWIGWPGNIRRVAGPRRNVHRIVQLATAGGAVRSIS